MTRSVDDSDSSRPTWRDGCFVREETLPSRPPPRSETGLIGWARENLFSSPLNIVLTVASLWAAWWTVDAAIDWAITRSVWHGEDREACLSENAGYTVGACWAFAKAKLSQWIYGRYPEELRWRVDVCYVLGLGLLIPLAIPSAPLKRANVLAMFGAYPLLTFWMLTGGLGLEPVDTRLWGGLMVTLVVAVTGIVVSLPLGALLALGRRSSMPAVRFISIAFIELWRGVPLITILFMASNALPLFLPSGVSLDNLLRALIGVAFFASAYMAEVVRGGLQAIPRGQYEGAQALGIGYWSMMRLIVLPQALRLVIPGIVNSFIALFKDTTLVSIISLFDLLGIVQDVAVKDPKWATPSTVWTGYLSLCAVYWVFCFGMSQYSNFVERRLRTGFDRSDGTALWPHIAALFGGAKKGGGGS